jgi:acid phosphatase type 7
VVVAWGTNMAATGEVAYSQDGQPTRIAANQDHGLKDLEDGLARVFIPLPSFPAAMNLTAHSEGIKTLNPTSVDRAGSADSENLTIPFPAPGQAISFVAFSDLHEQVDIYEQLSAQVPWDQIDLAVYNGDLLNNTMDARQVTRAILGLPTGDRDLPRVFVRGNHETRAKSARLLDDWLLPTDGRWYHAFTAGNTFFIVLDSGEDKPDDDIEYGGLVDFSAYQQQQADWLAQVLASPEYKAAQYRVVLLHIPLFGEWGVTPEFEPLAAQLRGNTGIDLMINGHTHEYGLFLPEETGLPYPVAFSGGPESDSAAAVIVNMDDDMLRINIVDVNGTIVDQIP